MNTSKYTDRKAAKRITRHPAYQRCRERANENAAAIELLKKQQAERSAATKKACLALLNSILAAERYDISTSMATFLKAALGKIAENA